MERSQDVASLAQTLGLTAAGIYRALRLSSSEAVAQVLGEQLGFTARFVALLHHRDALDHAMAQEDRRRKRNEHKLAAFRRRIAELDAELDYENPFASSGSCKRLAFTAMRKERGVKLWELARAHAQRVGGRTSIDLATLRAFEENRPADDFDLEAWLETLGTIAGRPVTYELTVAELERRAASLQLAHSVADTMHWDDVGEEFKSGSMRIFGAPKGSKRPSMRWGRSCTAFGAIRIEAIEAKQDGDRERGPLRLVNASHQSFEIGVVIRGRVRIDLSKTKFPDETRGAPPPIDGDAAETRIHTTGDVLAFQARRWHRVEFLGEDNLVLMVIVERNVSLGRRLGRVQPP